ncbi:hypothetical protein QQP08_015982 [Theobroma cacao]|nr:hypothetical protein QQP08_015982 [Theobroma cacao]
MEIRTEIVTIERIDFQKRTPEKESERERFRLSAFKNSNETSTSSLQSIKGRRVSKVLSSESYSKM